MRFQPSKDGTRKEYIAQVTVEKAFRTKAEAERWAQQQDTKLTLEAEVDSISRSIWEPGS